MRKHRGWGDSISWMSVDDSRIYGFLSQRPRKGDFILAPMESGKVGKFKIVELETKSDPPDMFFATVKPIDYATPKEEEKAI